MMATGLVELNPPKALEFDFTRPDQYEVVLQIKNVTPGPIAFKVKTTAPRAYLVRPSNDWLDTGATVDVKIFLQPNAQRRVPHRFLVQAVPIDKKENISKEEWTDKPKEEVQELRLEVVEKAGDLQSKYDELMNYLLKLEKECRLLKEERDSFAARAGGDPFSSGFSLWIVILAMIMGVLMTQVPHYM